MVIKMGKKKRTTVYIDNDILELLKYDLSCSFSDFVEKQAVNYVYGKDSIDKLENELKKTREAIKELELKEKNIMDKINELKEIQSKNNKNEELISKCMDTIIRINNNNGYVTYGQLNNISRIHNISKHILIEKCREMEIRLIDT